MTSTPPPKIGQADKLILIVDDESIIRELLSEVLELEGFTTRMEENADLALAYLQGHSSGVALLLTDINMPGSINGAVLANLSGQTWPEIPVIVMSGLESPESSGVGRNVLFIRKPFTMDEVVGYVRGALGLSD